MIFFIAPKGLVKAFQLECFSFTIFNNSIQDVQSENQILHQDCEDDSTPSQSNARSNGLLVSPKCYPAADSTKNTSGSCMNKKWGATSKTRQQARAEECEKKDLFPPRAPTVSR